MPTWGSSTNPNSSLTAFLARNLLDAALNLRNIVVFVYDLNRASKDGLDFRELVFVSGNELDRLHFWRGSRFGFRQIREYLSVDMLAEG